MNSHLHCPPDSLPEGTIHLEAGIPLDRDLLAFPDSLPLGSSYCVP